MEQYRICRKMVTLGTGGLEAKAHQFYSGFPHIIKIRIAGISNTGANMALVPPALVVHETSPSA